jgi:CRP/FNR family transcriptional regulator, cyclic AMP receptor protein
VFYINNVKTVMTSDQGKEAGILGEGEFFGEYCLIAEQLRLTTAIALADSTLMRINKAEMVGVLHDQPTFAELVFDPTVDSRASNA